MSSPVVKINNMTTLFANDDNDSRNATAWHVDLMAETNVSAYFASKRRIGTGKALTWK
jgi:hypothetical protein